MRIRNLIRLTDPSGFVTSVLPQVVLPFVPAGTGIGTYFLLDPVVHWGIALAAAVITGFAALWALTFLRVTIQHFWPQLVDDDHHRRLAVKSMTDGELTRADLDYLHRQIQHTPQPGEQRCPVCGTLAPARCAYLLDAEAWLFAIKVERRLRREDQPKENES